MESKTPEEIIIEQAEVIDILRTESEFIHHLLEEKMQRITELENLLENGKNL